MRILFWACIPVLFTLSCQKDEDVKKDNQATPSKYDLTIKLKHSFGSSPLKLSIDKYVTAANDTIKVNAFVYFFTNVKLIRGDGSSFAPENYALVDASDSNSSVIIIKDVPEGTYSKIAFFMGVDSVKNHTLGNTGALDPSSGMLWPWNTGYIFCRLRGKIGAANTDYVLDLGGDSHLMKYELPASISMNKAVLVNMNVDVNEIFQDPVTYDFKIHSKQIHDITNGDIPKLVQNAADMITITSIQ